MKSIFSFIIGFVFGILIFHSFSFNDPKDDIEFLPVAFGSVMHFDLPNPFADSTNLKNIMVLNILIKHSLSLDTSKFCDSERCHSISIENDNDKLIVKRHRKELNCSIENDFSTLTKEISNYQQEYSVMDVMDGYETTITFYDYRNSKMIYNKFPPVSDDMPNAQKITTIVKQIFESCKDTI